MMMNMGGPQKTGSFKGFGFGVKKDGAAAGKAQPSKPKAVTARQAGSSGATAVASLFAQVSEKKEDATSSGSIPTWSKPTAEALKAKRDADVLLAEDPSVFQYDEVLDGIHREREAEGGGGSQSVRNDAVTQKKRVGLTIIGETQVATGMKRSAKYIEKVMVATDRRRVEQQVVEDRLLKKEKDARKDCEVFVTAAFKEELKKRQKFVDELEAQEARDELQAADKQQHGRGFADMYRNLLNGGLASSRGAEKVKDIIPAREELDQEEKEALAKEERIERKVEAKEEEEEKAVVEEKVATLKREGFVKEDVKEEADPGGFGVAELTVAPSTTAKAELEAREKEERVEKSMSARERYLARKKAAESAAAAAG